MTDTSASSPPAPGLAPLVADKAAAFLTRNPHEFGDHLAVSFGDRQWTHAEYFEESCRFAALFLERLPDEGPRHVAGLLDNTPDYLFAFGGAAVIGAGGGRRHVAVLLDNTPVSLFVLGGAALIGAAVVVLTHPRRDEHLLRDARH